MPDADLVARLTDVAQQMINREMTGQVDGNDVAREAGEDPSSSEVYWAFREIERRGELDFCGSWEGGMGLPRMIRLP